MTDILVKWLNDDIRLSQRVDATNVPEAFRSGYLLAELLHRRGCIDTLSDYIKSDTTSATLQNFERLRPVFRALHIDFPATQASGIIHGDKNVTESVLYQLFRTLDKLPSVGASKLDRRPYRPRTRNPVQDAETVESLAANDAKRRFLEKEDAYFNKTLRESVRRRDQDQEKITQGFQDQQVRMVEKRIEFERQEEAALRKIRADLREQLIEAERSKQKAVKAHTLTPGDEEGTITTQADLERQARIEAQDRRRQHKKQVCVGMT